MDLLLMSLWSLSDWIFSKISRMRDEGSHLCKFLPIDVMVGARVRSEHHNESSVEASKLGHLDHGGHVAGLLVDDEEEDLTGDLGLVLQLDHLGHPVGLLWIVIRDVLAFEVGNGHVHAPGGGVAAAAQEHLIGRGGGSLGPQLAFPSLFRNLGHLQGYHSVGKYVPYEHPHSPEQAHSGLCWDPSHGCCSTSSAPWQTHRTPRMWCGCLSLWRSTPGHSGASQTPGRCWGTGQCHWTAAGSQTKEEEWLNDWYGYLLNIVSAKYHKTCRYTLPVW